jgi:hypothetical protein
MYWLGVGISCLGIIAAFRFHSLKRDVLVGGVFQKPPFCLIFLILAQLSIQLYRLCEPAWDNTQKHTIFSREGKSIPIFYTCQNPQNLPCSSLHSLRRVSAC